MSPQSVFYLFIAIIVIKFVFDTILNYLNAQHFKDAIPKELEGVFDDAEYKKSQQYKETNYKFGVITSLFSVILTLLFFFLEGFAFVDNLVQNVSQNTIVQTLLFFGIIFFGSDVLNTPFSYYKTFVIEERFGFNKTTIKTFFLDKIKSWFMLIILGGGILALITWFYKVTGAYFWIYAWLLVTMVTLFLNMFYSKIIVPLFNKQYPLEDGNLKTAIHNFAQKVGFKIQNIFVIDGSKRSTKANAYFSGFGQQKRITFYDTLLQELNTEEVVAVLAHEVGHYKKRHIIYNMVLSVILTGFTLFILSLLVGNETLSQALGVEAVSFHIGLIAFTILFSPISEVTGFFMNILSRKFEYEADDFAKKTASFTDLISALKKLSKSSLSNLTPHPLYVKIHYSHPTLLQRIINLKN
jgi:STE24 endopeptidase